MDTISAIVQIELHEAVRCSIQYYLIIINNRPGSNFTACDCPSVVCQSRLDHPERKHPFTYTNMCLNMCLQYPPSAQHRRTVQLSSRPFYTFAPGHLYTYQNQSPSDVVLSWSRTQFYEISAPRHASSHLFRGKGLHYVHISHGTRNSRYLHCMPGVCVCVQNKGA